MEINVSAYMSSIRPYRWIAIHEMLKKTKLNFEIVIVGPNEPDFDLPEEIKFFKSEVKPSQCFYAAGEFCSGEVMLQLVDDLEYSDGALNMMHKEVLENDNVMATAHYFMDEKDESLSQNISGYAINNNYLPLLPVCGMFSRKAWLDNKGIDVRFDGVMGELDFYMRLRINGYNTKFVNGICKEKREFQNKESSGGLCAKYWSKDRASFLRLWITEQVIQGFPLRMMYPIRNDIVRPYKKENLLTISQYYV